MPTDRWPVLVVKYQAADLEPKQVVFLDNRWRQIIEIGEPVYEFPAARGMPKLDNRYVPVIVSHDKKLWGRVEGEFPQPDPTSPVRAYMLTAVDLYDVQIHVPLEYAIKAAWQLTEATHA